MRLRRRIMILAISGTSNLIALIPGCRGMAAILFLFSQHLKHNPPAMEKNDEIQR